MTSLTKKYGLSDVGLRKICKKLKIPLPGLGYWAKVQAGYSSTKPPLPPAPGLEELVVWRSPIDPDPLQVTGDEFSQLVLSEKAPDKRIHVEEKPTQLHPLLVQAVLLMRASESDDWGLLRLPDAPCLDIRVSRGSFDRAVHVMQAILTAIESRGHTVSIVKEEFTFVTVARVCDETVPFCLREETERVERELTAREKKEKLKRPWLFSEPQYETVPSGELTLRVIGHAGRGIRRTWGDTPKTRLEDQRNSFMVGPIRSAAAVRVDRLERERREREWEERERRRIEQEQRRIEEQQRIEQLDGEMAAWQKARRIREYADAVRKAATKAQGSIEPGSDVDTWLSWMLLYAERIDPFGKKKSRT